MTVEQAKKLFELENAAKASQCYINDVLKIIIELKGIVGQKDKVNE